MEFATGYKFCCDPSSHNLNRSIMHYIAPKKITYIILFSGLTSRKIYIWIARKHVSRISPEITRHVTRPDNRPMTYQLPGRPHLEPRICTNWFHVNKNVWKIHSCGLVYWPYTNRCHNVGTLEIWPRNHKHWVHGGKLQREYFEWNRPESNTQPRFDTPRDNFLIRKKRTVARLSFRSI